MLGRAINGDIKQVLYNGEKGTESIFFFKGRQSQDKSKTTETVFTSLEVVSFGDKEQASGEDEINQNTQQETDATNEQNFVLHSFKISESSGLQQALKELLFPNQNRQFCLPEPKLIKFQEKHCLVISQLTSASNDTSDESHQPGVYFYECLGSGPSGQMSESA